MDLSPSKTELDIKKQKLRAAELTQKAGNEVLSSLQHISMHKATNLILGQIPLLIRMKTAPHHNNPKTLTKFSSLPISHRLNLRLPRMFHHISDHLESIPILLNLVQVNSLPSLYRIRSLLPLPHMSHPIYDPNLLFVKHRCRVEKKLPYLHIQPHPAPWHSYPTKSLLQNKYFQHQLNLL